jgi:hypothetical protein
LYCSEFWDIYGIAWDRIRDWLGQVFRMIVRVVRRFRLCFGLGRPGWIALRERYYNALRIERSLPIMLRTQSKIRVHFIME